MKTIPVTSARRDIFNIIEQTIVNSEPIQITSKNGDVVMLVDSLSYQYLVGSKVDYVEGLEGSRFIVENPNATTTCGCGSSFSI